MADPPHWSSGLDGDDLVVRCHICVPPLVLRDDAIFDMGSHARTEHPQEWAALQASDRR